MRYNKYYKYYIFYIYNTFTYIGLRIMKYISLPLFILSFLIGMVYIYMSSPPNRSILIYPTVDNNGKFQYIDKAENCFTFEAKEDKCPFNTGSLKKIPIQV